MTSHRLDASLDTAVDVLTAERAPVLRVADGDTVTVRTLSAAGYTERVASPGADAPTLLDGRRGHCLVGPIAVTGAAPDRSWPCGSTRSCRTTGATPGPAGSTRN